MCPADFYLHVWIVFFYLMFFIFAGCRRNLNNSSSAWLRSERSVLRKEKSSAKRIGAMPFIVKKRRRPREFVRSNSRKVKFTQFYKRKIVCCSNPFFIILLVCNITFFFCLLNAYTPTHPHKKINRQDKIDSQKCNIEQYSLLKFLKAKAFMLP